MALTKNEVLDVVANSDEFLTATGIDKSLGFAKKTRKLVEMLDSLVEIGAISENSDERYIRYVLEDEAALENAIKYKLEEFNGDNVTIPVDTKGYTVEAASRGFRVTLPNGNVHNCSRTQRILVINEEKHLLIKTPESILQAIKQYCTATQIEHCVLRDMSVGRIVGAEDVNTNPVLIFIAVERHNKAG